MDDIQQQFYEEGSKRRLFRRRIKAVWYWIKIFLISFTITFILGILWLFVKANFCN